MSITKPQNEIEKHEAIASHLRMLKNFGIASNADSMRFLGDRRSYDGLYFDQYPSSYEFPLTFIKGQPVFEDTVVYFVGNGRAEQANGINWYVYGMHDDWTLTKPEPIDSLADFRNLPVDTLVYVRERAMIDWLPRYFRVIENGRVSCWSDGMTSHTAEKDKHCTWDEASITRPSEYTPWSDEK